MIVLGINAFGHDAAAVLLIDGKVAFAASQERFDRVRHSAAFPAEAIEAALTHAGVSSRDVDHVAFPWTRGMARGRKLWHVLRHLPSSLAGFRIQNCDAVGAVRAGQGLALGRESYLTGRVVKLARKQELFCL